MTTTLIRLKMSTKRLYIPFYNKYEFQNHIHIKAYHSEMKCQKSCGPHWGKLVHQLLGVVTFSYNLPLGRTIASWKGIVEEIHFGGSIMPLAIIENLDLEKTSFRPSKWPQKLKPAKNSKLPKMVRKLF